MADQETANTADLPAQQATRKRRRLFTRRLVWAIPIVALTAWLGWGLRQNMLDGQLIAAIKHFNTPAALAALRAGADANARDISGASSWRYLLNLFTKRWETVNNSPPALIVFLERDPNRTNAFMSDVPPEGWSDDPRLTEALVAHGADVNAVNRFKQPAVLLAVHNQQMATARILIRHGAKVTVSRDNREYLLNTAIDARDPRPNDVVLVELMLEHGADPNLADMNGATPLYYAISNNRADMVSCLLQHHADPNLKFSAGGMCRPLDHVDTLSAEQIAGHQRWREVRKLLVDAGAKK